jgi:hypothetical protein
VSRHPGSISAALAPATRWKSFSTRSGLTRSLRDAAAHRSANRSRSGSGEESSPSSFSTTFHRVLTPPVRRPGCSEISDFVPPVRLESRRSTDGGAPALSSNKPIALVSRWRRCRRSTKCSAQCDAACATPAWWSGEARVGGGRAVSGRWVLRRARPGPGNRDRLRARPRGCRALGCTAAASEVSRAYAPAQHRPDLPRLPRPPAAGRQARRAATRRVGAPRPAEAARYNDLRHGSR